jgi:uncharacterized protein
MSEVSQPWQPSAYQVMIKPRGPICNLACDYCYFLSKEDLYPDSDFRMSDAVLEDFTRQYIQSQRVPRVIFAWQGGEPTLMGLDFYRKAIGFQRKYARPGMMIENTIQTNGTLLTDDWCEFLKENNFLVGLSLDGPPRLHNIFRKDKFGAGTAERALWGLRLLQKHGVETNILCTVNSENAAYPLEVYRYFRDDLGMTFIQFIPIVEKSDSNQPLTQDNLTDRSVSGKMYGDFLISVFDEWLREDVGKVFVQIFDTALSHWLGVGSGLCIFERTCGLALALEHNGDLYACDHFVDPAHFLGNITTTPMIDLVCSDQQQEFGLRKKETLPQTCLECEVLFACQGGCPKNRLGYAPDGEAGLNILCEGYLAFFRHIHHPMQQMAALLRKQK